MMKYFHFAAGQVQLRHSKADYDSLDTPLLKKTIRIDGVSYFSSLVDL
jgi:hypothetical protein